MTVEAETSSQWYVCESETTRFQEKGKRLRLISINQIYFLNFKPESFVIRMLASVYKPDYKNTVTVFDCFL